MSTTTSSPARNGRGHGDGDGDIAVDLFPFLRVYSDGRVKRYGRQISVPAASDVKSPDGIVTKDVVIDDETGVSVRLFLPVDAAAAAAGGGRRLPLVVYIHGGGFCTGSASSPQFHRYAESLAARAAAVVVSVDYRIAPEHPLPAAYDDAWAALRWAAGSRGGVPDDSWVGDYADRTCMFVAGESSGASIVHNVALRAAGGGDDGVDIDIEGIILLQPCFWGSARLPSEKPDAWRTTPEFLPEKMDALWRFATAGAAGDDDPRINPPAEAIASLPCRRALVAVADEILLDRGRQYAARLCGGAWGGEVTLVESEGVGHCFHLSPEFNPKTVELMDHVVEFIARGKTSTPTSMLMDRRRRRCTNTSNAAPSWRASGGPSCTAQTGPTDQCSGPGMDNIGPASKAQKYPLSAAVLKSCL